MIDKNIHNIMLFLLILALFIGATTEYSHGSPYVGVLLFIVAVVIIFMIKMDTVSYIKASKFRVIAGVLIIASDIIYNLIVSSKLGTLDTMTFLLGASLIASNLKDEQVRKMGVFGMYMSLSFVILFILFFGSSAMTNELIHNFDHYFVMLPSAYLCMMIGVPVEVVSTETLHISGMEDLTVTIGGPCSGLYSLFLLVSMVIAYAVTERIQETKKILGILGVAVAVAYIANLTRVSIIYVVAYLYGSEAMQTFHLHTGWIIFVIVATLLMWMLSRIRMQGHFDNETPKTSF